MNENKITIDKLTVTETLRQKGILEQCGGVGYVTELPQAVPTIANVEYYRDLILDCAVRRDLIRFGHETIKESHDISRPVKSVVEGLDQQFSRFTVGNDTNGILTVSNILTDLVDDIEKKMNSLQLYDGIESGFPVLDELTTGFKEEEMIIVGARPSIGKTAFALSMAINMAIHKDVPVGFFSLEMSAADIMRRLLSCESRVPMDRIKRPQKLQEDDLQRIYQAAVAGNFAQFEGVVPRAENSFGHFSSVEPGIGEGGRQRTAALQCAGFGFNRAGCRRRDAASPSAHHQTERGREVSVVSDKSDHCQKP